MDAWQIDSNEEKKNEGEEKEENQKTYAIKTKHNQNLQI